MYNDDMVDSGRIPLDDDNYVGQIPAFGFKPTHPESLGEALQHLNQLRPGVLADEAVEETFRLAKDIWFNFPEARLSIAAQVVMLTGADLLRVDVYRAAEQFLGKDADEARITSENPLALHINGILSDFVNHSINKSSEDQKREGLPVKYLSAFMLDQLLKGDFSDFGVSQEGQRTLDPNYDNRPENDFRITKEQARAERPGNGG